MLKDIVKSIRNYASLWRRILVLYYLNSTSKEQVTGDTDVIVSLTSYGERTRGVWRTIECIANASSKPKRIILWLGTGDEDKPINRRIKRLQDRGLEIRFVKDLGPHTKYFYAVDECINANLPLVTIDDDVLYLPWFLQELFASHLTEPKAIHCFRARKAVTDANGNIAPYSTWRYINHKCMAVGPFFTGVGGVLYPVYFLELLRNQGARFKETCPKADDIWLNFVAIKHNICVCQVYDKAVDFAVSPRTQKTTLWSENSVDGNDDQLQSTFDEDALGKLKSLSSCY